jgi:hypothetical protein
MGREGERGKGGKGREGRIWEGGKTRRKEGGR